MQAVNGAQPRTAVHACVIETLLTTNKAATGTGPINGAQQVNEVP